MFSKRRFGSDEDSKSAANVGRSRGVTSWFGPARSKTSRLRGAQDKESGIDHVYGVNKGGLMFGNKRFDMNNGNNYRWRTIRRHTRSLWVDFQENSRRCFLHGKRYAQIQEHAIGDERAQTQVPFAESIIEQQRIQVQTRNCADVGHTQETEEEIWKEIISRNDIEWQRDQLRALEWSQRANHLLLLNHQHFAPSKQQRSW